MVLDPPLMILEQSEGMDLYHPLLYLCPLHIYLKSQYDKIKQSQSPSRNLYDGVKNQ